MPTNANAASKSSVWTDTYGSESKRLGIKEMIKVIYFKTAYSS